METVIQLKNGAVARVDAIDYGAVSALKWHSLKGKYARASVVAGGKPRTVLMHRLILGALPGQLVDHINGDGLDNRRSNLRIASAAGNARNAATRGASGVVGVRRSNKKWLASIAPDGVEISLGLWEEQADAAGVYAAAASILYGEFASRHAGSPNSELLALVIERKKAQISRLQAEVALLAGV